MQNHRPTSLRIALGQFNSTVGDLGGNTNQIIDQISRARDFGCQLVAFPELALTGYPPEDLLLKPSFIEDNLRHLDRVVAASAGIAVVVGFVDLDGDLYNSAAFAYDGKLVGVYHKLNLPNYGVFDEDRYFQRGRDCPVFELGGIRIGVSICEDAWFPTGPMSTQAARGADLLVNINGSPYHIGKRKFRQTMMSTRAMDSRAFVAWVNLVGGQDELVFDGNSMIFGPDGELIANGPSFREALVVADLEVGSILRERLHDTRLRKSARDQQGDNDVIRVRVASNGEVTGRSVPSPKSLCAQLDGSAEVYAALVTGTSDYVRKATRFEKVVLGLSGGIDSALTATIAVDALGADNVIGVLMPSRFTSSESLEDATRLASNLNIKTHEIPIEPTWNALSASLADTFQGTAPGLTEENQQARIRGLILMSLSNKFDWLLLTTGNKSELATGYCTLYGDMAGGFAVLKDIPKTLVYELCRHRNESAGKAVIPRRVFEKPPSAELRLNQKDQDSLPAYDQLDPILKGYVEDDRSFEELAAAGHDPAIVKRVISLVDNSEYKRRQAPPGVKITPRAFGRDRRMPLTNRYQPDGLSSLRVDRPV